MKLTLQTKIERDLPLNIGEICQATGYSRYKIRLINPPMAAGKCRLSRFWKHESEIAKPRYVINGDITEGYAAAAESSDLQTTVRKLRGLLPKHAQQGACNHLC